MRRSDWGAMRLEDLWEQGIGFSRSRDLAWRAHDDDGAASGSTGTAVGEKEGSRGYAAGRIWSGVSRPVWPWPGYGGRRRGAGQIVRTRSDWLSGSNNNACYRTDTDPVAMVRSVVAETQDWPGGVVADPGPMRMRFGDGGSGTVGSGGSADGRSVGAFVRVWRCDVAVRCGCAGASFLLSRSRTCGHMHTYPYTSGAGVGGKSA